MTGGGRPLLFGVFERVAAWLTARTESQAGRRVRVLAEARDVEALVAALDDPDYAVKGRAASALGRLGDPAGLDELARRLDSPVETDQLAGLHGLWRAGDDRRIEPARRWLADRTRSSRLRHAAAAALGDDELLRIVEDPATDAELRELAEGVLRASGWRP